MPTEITAEMRMALSRVAGSSKPQQSNGVIEANMAVTRNNLSDSGQTVPSIKESSQPSSQYLEHATESLNKHVQSLKRDLHFSIDEDTGETVIRVVDSESQKLIRTIPSEEFLNVQERLNQNVGVLLNSSV